MGTPSTDRSFGLIRNDLVAFRPGTRGTPCCRTCCDCSMRRSPRPSSCLIIAPAARCPRAPTVTQCGSCAGRVLTLLASFRPHFLPRPRPPGRSRIPTKPSTRKPRAGWSKARTGRAALQLRRALAETDPLLLGYSHSIRRNGCDRVHGALRLGAFRPRARAADVGRGARLTGDCERRLDRVARLQRPVTATSLWRGSRCLICRSPSSSRRPIWCAMRAADPVETIPASWAALAGLAAGLGFLTKGPLAVVIPAIVLVPIYGGGNGAPSHFATSHVVIASCSCSSSQVFLVRGDVAEARHAVR